MSTLPVVSAGRGGAGASTGGATAATGAAAGAGSAMGVLFIMKNTSPAAAAAPSPPSTIVVPLLLLPSGVTATCSPRATEPELGAAAARFALVESSDGTSTVADCVAVPVLVRTPVGSAS